MLAIELEGVLNAHAFLRVERPPELWDTAVELEAFLRVLGEMIAAALVRSGQQLGEITLNASNVTVDPSAADSVPAGDFLAITIRSRGDWSPEATWLPDRSAPTFVSSDLEGALAGAGAAYGYTRVLGGDKGSVTVLFAATA